MLIQNQFLEIIKHEILYDISIHVIHVSELVTSEVTQLAETVQLTASQFSSSISWKIAYQKFLWFHDMHHYLLEKSCSKKMSSHQQQVLLLKKYLNYRIQNDIFWYNYHDFIVTCISEKWVFFILYEVHDLKNHWVKEETLTRLKKYVYWFE